MTNLINHLVFAAQKSMRSNNTKNNTNNTISPNETNYLVMSPLALTIESESSAWQQSTNLDTSSQHTKSSVCARSNSIHNRIFLDYLTQDIVYVSLTGFINSHYMNAEIINNTKRLSLECNEIYDSEIYDNDNSDNKSVNSNKFLTSENSASDNYNSDNKSVNSNKFLTSENSASDNYNSDDEFVNSNEFLTSENSEIYDIYDNYNSDDKFVNSNEFLTSENSEIYEIYDNYNSDDKFVNSNDIINIDDINNTFVTSADASLQQPPSSPSHRGIQIFDIQNTNKNPLLLRNNDPLLSQTI